MFPKTLLLLACVALIALPAVARTPLLDPVTTFTNGMSLPSTDPMRTHNAYYGCDPYRIGCCGGHYNRPCLLHALAPNTCCKNRRVTASLDCSHRAGSIEGVEPQGMVTLGAIPAPATGLTPTGPPGVGGGGASQPSVLQNLIGR